MDNDYKILGLEPGASQMDIKKAYFKLIRKHSPESDPEMFQQIRKAYENLKDRENIPEGPSFPVPEDEFARRMLAQIQKCQEIRNYELARDTCEEALFYFPNEIQFRYLLVSAQIECGNTGKAVKNAELLVKTEPQNKWFQRLLALSYYERGYTNKAWPAFDKAYQMGCNDFDFILSYNLLCTEFGDHDRGREILHGFLRQKEKWGKTEIPQLAELMVALLSSGRYAADIDFINILETASNLFEEYQIYMADYISTFGMTMHLLQVTRYSLPDVRIITPMDHFLELLYKACQSDSDRTMVHDIRLETAYQRFSHDMRLTVPIIHLCDVVHFTDDMDPEIIKFARLDSELCMIEEREEMLKQEAILRQEYPLLYEGMESYFRNLDNEDDLPLRKENLKKQYQRLEPYCEGGIYYENYPQERPKAQGTVINAGAEDMPYMRASAKIGRNDPCPCGSGKKYKKCCMNKGRG